jgi:hypothetical protein
MPRRYYRISKAEPYLCDITKEECDFPSELGDKVCGDCDHYNEWKRTREWEKNHSQKG